MRFASRLRDRFIPERFHALATELFKFGAVGCVNTVVDFILVNALLFIGPLKAKIVAVVVATTLSYIMNRQWTYKDRDSGGMRREYILFFALNGVGLLIQEAVLAVAKYGLHFSESNPDDRLAFNIANAAGIGLAMIFRFWAYRTWVFTPGEPERSTEEREIEALEVAFSDTAVVAPDDRQIEALEAAFSDPAAAPPAPRQPAEELETPAAKR
ncbi:MULTISPECIES: GtrA family protein [Dactylosporangium]|uniref:Membrane protein n=2 Tax=Dactylosporangium TaxID=35753 RepID=A0A9W6KEC6_9ACTN|nr:MULTISPECIES: GtrA family protein [Dactylosporangium]UAB97505.1 GtrA family protein [Dactylosporangium vinaceum]UWZ45770.1 GtrA family protein [Dactylosporangium matsuzakiense]GLK99962.1 membrane protein [Dactylosporangium matsuzakiense]